MKEPGISRSRSLERIQCRITRKKDGANPDTDARSRHGHVLLSGRAPECGIWHCRSLGAHVTGRASRRLHQPVSGLVRGRLFEQNRIAAARTWLSFAPTRFPSRDAAAVHALAGIGRAPDVLAMSAGVFKLDVHSADDAFATHKADNAATDATGIRHVGETRPLASPPERI